jgi:hypothetical protein
VADVGGNAGAEALGEQVAQALLARRGTDSERSERPRYITTSPSEEQFVDEYDDDDLDWSEAERRARVFDQIAEAWEQMRDKQYVPVNLDKLPAGLRFDVQTFSDGHDTMEFTLLDPVVGRVRVTDNFYFPEPTDCVLFGSEDDLDGNGAMLPGVVKRNAKLVFEVGGQRLRHAPGEAVWCVE